MLVKFCLENGGSSLKVSRGEGGRVTRVCFRGKLNMLHCVCVCVDVHFVYVLTFIYTAMIVSVTQVLNGGCLSMYFVIFF